MKLLDDFRKRRAEKLADKGFELVEAGEFDKALKVAAEVDRLGYSAALEIAAQAHAGKGDLVKAVQVLEEGVEKAPDAWLNWQLLGNYRSDLERFDEARQAYERALDCPGVSRSSIRLNQATLAMRTGDYDAAFRLAGEVEDPDMAAWAAAVKVGALAAMGRGEEAELLGVRALNEAEESSDPGRLSSIAADVARVRMARGDSREEIRGFVLDRLKKDRGNEYLLDLIRDLDGRSSGTSRLYRLLVRGEIPEDSPLAAEVAGFFCTWKVIADSPEEALEFVRALDDPPARLVVEEWEALEPVPDVPKGVYWRTGRAYFDEED